MKTSRNGILFIARREALVLVAYQDGVHRSIGFGSNSETLKEGDTITVKGAFALLRKDIEEREKRIEGLLKRSLKTHQWDALMSLHYQSGNRYLPAIAALLNAKQDVTALELWLLCDRNLAGQRLDGLHKRRVLEVKLFQNGEYGELSPIPFWRGNPRSTKREEYEVRDADLPA